MGWITRNVPAPVVNAARRVLLAVTRQPQLGSVRYGELRRTQPISRHFGCDRGGAVDRHYIEGFLDRHRPDVRGHVLEVGEDTYTRRYGGDQVERCDVLHVSADNRNATIVADLADAPHIPDDTFDCIILTQTLQLIFRPDAALATLHRVLKPGGVLLLTVPGITQIATDSEWGSTWYWSFTDRSVGRLLEEAFGEGRTETGVHGNVLAAATQLYGLGAMELTPEELAHTDPDYQVIITGRAVKSGGADGNGDDQA
jgi:SAM-dependent methyltransferase